MKKFIAKVLFLTALCCCLLLAVNVFVIGSQFTHKYTSALLDKIDRLESIDQPKIILTGDSALAFGICSERMEEELGMPVVNLGLHGALGDAFQENVAKLNIRPGDIVVLAHSDFSGDGRINDCSAAWMTIDCHFGLLRLCGWRDIGGMLAAYPTYFRKALSHLLNGVGQEIPENTAYSRYSFNKYGDIVMKPEDIRMNPDVFFAENPVTLLEISPACVRRIEKLNNYVTRQGASLVIAGYPIAYGKYAEFTEADVKAFESALREAMPCDVISDYTDYLFPYSMFYDTTLHLVQEGAELRTAQLIQDLKQWQAANAAP